MANIYEVLKEILSVISSQEYKQAPVNYGINENNEETAE